MATHESADSGEVLLDAQVAASIDGMGPASAARIWKATIAELPRLAERITASLASGDLAELERAAHAGKGSSGTVGLVALCSGMTQLNAAVRAGNLASAAICWIAVRPVLERSIDAIAAHIRVA